MSVITKRGQDAKQSANKKKVDYKKAFIRLKDGESIRVRVPSASEYVEYIAHNSFEAGIRTQPCIKPLGQPCAHCEASDVVFAADVDRDDKDHPLYAFRGLYGKNRYLFAFYDIDEGMVRVFDATKDQAAKLIGDIEDYADSLDDLAFMFKRSGASTSTTYGISPILKLKAEDQEKFDAFDGKIDANMYDDVLQARTYAEQIEELRAGRFPVDKYFKVPTTSDEGITEIDDPTQGF